jgi:hypothetical protein
MEMSGSASEIHVHCHTGVFCRQLLNTGQRSLLSIVQNFLFW